MRTPLPSFEGVRDWVNGGPLDEADLAGHPVVVQFWSVTCHICHETADQIAAWRAKYEPLGVKFVSVHQPRGPEELDVARVTADATGEMHITAPLAIDNTHAIVGRFENQFVPAFYVFDREQDVYKRQGLSGNVAPALTLTGGLTGLAQTVGVAFDYGLLVEIPDIETDVAMGWIVTDKRTIEIAPLTR